MGLNAWALLRRCPAGRCLLRQKQMRKNSNNDKKACNGTTTEEAETIDGKEKRIAFARGCICANGIV